MYGFKSLYGLQPETLDSLVLDFLPPLGHAYDALGEDSLVDDSQEVYIYLLQEIINALRNNAGFCIPKVSAIKHSIQKLVTCSLNFNSGTSE